MYAVTAVLFIAAICGAILFEGKIKKVVRSRVLRFNGIYQSQQIDDSWHYLRFYADGTVLSVTSTGSPTDVIRWLRKEEITSKKFSQDQYAVMGNRISFGGIVKYNGKAEGELLNLEYNSQNGHRRPDTYRFIHLEENLHSNPVADNTLSSASWKDIQVQKTKEQNAIKEEEQRQEAIRKEKVSELWKKFLDANSTLPPEIRLDFSKELGKYIGEYECLSPISRNPTLTHYHDMGRIRYQYVYWPGGTKWAHETTFTVDYNWNLKQQVYTADEGESSYVITHDLIDAVIDCAFKALVTSGSPEEQRSFVIKEAFSV